MQPATRTFFLKGALFATPILLALGLEIFALPIDAFTFRCWEALAREEGPWKSKWVPAAPFYPGIRIEKIETGDLGHNTEFAVAKPVVWETDDWGYRKSPSEQGPHDAVIVGDSFTAGASLTQSDTIYEVFELITGWRTYPYAPGRMSDLLADRRFHDAPPRVVVLQVVESFAVWILAKEEKDPGAIEPAPRLRDWGLEAPARAYEQVADELDRITKLIMLQWSRARIRDAGRRLTHELLTGRAPGRQPRLGVVGNDGKTLFHLGRAEYMPRPPQLVEAAVARVALFRETWEARGVRFLVLAIPSKENIYEELLGGAPKPTFQDEFVAKLRAAEVECIDLQKAFREARAKGKTLYHRDDSHWTPLGARIAAEQLAHAITEPERRTQVQEEPETGRSSAHGSAVVFR
jgi:hypothetical protein